MKVAVKDANILIDLVNGELLELCLLLPFEFVTTDLVLLQLEVEAQWSVVRPFVDSGALRTVSLSGSEMEEVVADPIYSSLGLEDTQVSLARFQGKGNPADRGSGLTAGSGASEGVRSRPVVDPDSDDRGGKARAASGRQGAEDHAGQRGRLPTAECERLLREWEK